MTSPATEPPPQLHPERKRSWWIYLVAAVVLVAGVWLFFHFKSASKPVGKTGNRDIPVLASAVKRGSLKIYLNGLGTVTALNTVTVRTRIDGQINKIAFTEGQNVNAGDLLVEIDPRPYEVLLTQAEGQLAKDKALLDNTKLDLVRYQNAGEAVSEQQLATSTALVAQYEGAVKTDQGQIDSAKLDLTYCRITAPISGRVGLRLVDQGNMVHASDSTGLLVITQVEPIAVVFSLPEDNLPKVLQAVRDQTQLPVEAYDRDFKNRISLGSLLAVDNQIDPTTGTIRFKAIFPNEDQMLFPNQFVNIRLLVDTRQDVVLAPSTAIQHNPRSTFVYVVKADHTVEIRTITTGATEGSQIVIEQGLQPDEIVVTDGVDKLQSGSKVSLSARDGSKSKNK